MKLPWEPFLGTLAVAPDLEAITALAPGPFGGNMDVPDVKPGNTVYLPVWDEGALVYTGDCHARQGQGELCGVAEDEDRGPESSRLQRGQRPQRGNLGVS